MIKTISIIRIFLTSSITILIVTSILKSNEPIYYNIIPYSEFIDSVKNNAVSRLYIPNSRDKPTKVIFNDGSHAHVVIESGKEILTLSIDIASEPKARECNDYTFENVDPTTKLSYQRISYGRLLDQIERKRLESIDIYCEDFGYARIIDGNGLTTKTQHVDIPNLEGVLEDLLSRLRASDIKFHLY